MKSILIPNMSKHINFSNPFNGRKWLKLLDSNIKYGMLFKKNLKYDKKKLGFSFSSNNYGLRGPCNVNASNIILGTSFAMGLSVDEGNNWYDLAIDNNKWFNASMPVGPQNNIELINDFYKGDFKTLLYVYHPNIWKISRSFDTALRKKKDIFSHLKWKTSFSSVFPLYLKWISKENIKIKLGYSIYKKNNGKEYHLDTRYNYLDFISNTKFVNKQISLLNQIFKRFSKVIVIRVPVKEEIFPINNNDLTDLKNNYDLFWNLFKNNKDNNNLYFYDYSKKHFSIDDYLQYDTHWNQQGNQTFAKLVKKNLLDNNINS